jgi:hypothetical protein
MPDEKQRAIATRRGNQFGGVFSVEITGKRLMNDRLDAEFAARKPCRVKRTHSRAGERLLDDDADCRECAPSRARLPLPTIGEAAIEVGARAVILGVTVPQ